VVDGAGKIIREQRIASEPEALIAWFRGLGFGLERIGLKAGPMSQWLHAAMRAAGLAVELLETRHVRDAFKAMPVKSDRNDARGIAQLMRLGWFRPVHCKSMAAQEVRALLTVYRRGVPAPIGAGVPASPPVKSITWRGHIQADGGHFSINIHRRGHDAVAGLRSRQSAPCAQRTGPGV
jgi:hypothetical protein